MQCNFNMHNVHIHIGCYFDSDHHGILLTHGRLEGLVPQVRQRDGPGDQQVAPQSLTHARADRDAQEEATQGLFLWPLHTKNILHRMRSGCTLDRMGFYVMLCNIYTHRMHTRQQITIGFCTVHHMCIWYTSDRILVWTDHNNFIWLKQLLDIFGNHLVLYYY